MQTPAARIQYIQAFWTGRIILVKKMKIWHPGSETAGNLSFKCISLLDILFTLNEENSLLITLSA